MPPLEPFTQLVKVLSRLPGVGRRSAERIAMELARNRETLAHELKQAIARVEDEVCICDSCGNLTQNDRNPCTLCTDPSRDASVLCVVEDPGDIRLIEGTGAFKGRYHALMGKLSPMQGKGVPQLRLDGLQQRIERDGVREVILAMNSDVESDATASFLHDLLAGREVRLSRLALGLPAGSGIAYSDPVTLGRAIEGRQTVQFGQNRD